MAYGNIKDKNTICNAVATWNGSDSGVKAKFSLPWRPGTPKIKTPGVLDARKIKLNGSPAVKFNMFAV